MDGLVAALAANDDAVSRATVAAAMLDEAENPAYAGGVAVPLQR
jgi:hypothetical protein